MKLPEKIRFSVPIISLAKKLGLEVEEERCLCPFHEGKEKSVRLIPTENRFQCEICSAGGFQIELVEKAKGVSRGEAIKWLSAEYEVEEDADEAERIRMKWMKERQSVSLDDVFGKGSSARFGVGKGSEDVGIYRAIVEDCRMTEPAKSFLAMRKYSDEVVRKQKLGWIGEPRVLYERLKKEFGEGAIENAGLLDRGQRFLLNDHRLIYPFFSGGEAVFVAGRRIDGRRPVFLTPKRKIPPIYNMDILEGLEKGAPLYVTPDLNGCFAFLLKGYPSVAVLRLQDEIDGSFKKLSSFDIVACGENDDRGREFNRKLLSLFSGLGKDIHIQLLPESLGDWNDYVVFKKRL